MSKLLQRCPKCNCVLYSQPFKPYLPNQVYEIEVTCSNDACDFKDYE